MQAVAARRPTLSAGRVTFSAAASQHLQSPSPILLAVGTTTLPDGAVNMTSGKGVTNTGMVRLPDGEFWIGNAGVAETGDVGLVRLSPDLTTILQQITYSSLAISIASGTDSVQGIYRDSDGSPWGADPLKARVYHFDPAGPTLLESFAVAGSSVLAFDSDDGELALIASRNNRTAVWSDTTGTATGRTLPVTETDIDYLGGIDSGKLLVSAGANGDAGSIMRIDVATGDVEAVSTVPGAWAIEGFAAEGGTFWVNSGGYRHNSGSLLNEVVRTAFPASIPSYYALGGHIFLCLFLRLAFSPSTARSVLSIGAQDAAGVCLSTVASSLASSRVSAGDVSATFTGFSLATEALYHLEIDLPGNNCVLGVNGVIKGSAAFASPPAVTALASEPVSLGTSLVADRFFNGSLGPVIVAKGTPVVLLERQKQEGWCAWKATGNGALLSAGHPYKSAAP